MNEKIWKIFEQLLKENEDVLRRLKEKDTYTIEDFLKARKNK